MDIGNAAGALIVAFLITVLELTEVVAIVYALGASAEDMRPGIHGALSGVALVGLVALATGVAIAHFLGPVTLYLLIVSALLLWGFGFFLLRSTVKTYFREAKKHLPTASRDTAGEDLSSKALFSGGFSVGSVETLEAVIVLLALTAGGYGLEALLGFLAGGALLATLGYLLHENIRKVKVPQMKWIGTSLLFTFAVFWTGEALVDQGVFAWPSLGPLPVDLLILPILGVALLIIRGVVSLRVASKMASLA